MPEIKKVSGPGGRHYIHPDTGQQVPGVTTILKVLDKPALVGWAAREVATYAADHMEALELLDRDERVALLKGTPFRKRDKAADSGTEAHLYAERRLMFGIAPDPQSHSEELVDEVLEFINPVPVLSEATVWNRAHTYAGTFDGIWKVGRRHVLIDWKSGSGVYDETGLQLNAYARAPQVITDSTVMPMPHIDAAYAIHVPNEGGWSVVPIRLGDDEWLAFRAARALWKWKYQQADLTLGQPSQKMK